MRRSRTSSVVALCLFTLWLSVSPAVQGQESPAPSEEQEKGVLLTDSLLRLAYDPARNGPLFAVALPTDRTRKETRSLRAAADAFGRRIVSVGSLTVLAPREMTLIVTPTGRGDVRQGLNEGQAFTLLLDSLTDGQFARFSGDGLSYADLTEEQRPLFDAMFPKPIKATLQRLTFEDKSLTFDSAGPEQSEKIFRPDELRLRIFQQANAAMKATGKEVTYTVAGDLRRAEETLWLKTFDSFDTNDAPPEAAFGRSVYPKVPSRLKPSELDYSASALNAPITLTAREKTLGEVIATVAAATGLELFADRRIAALPVVWRVASQQTARAGDALEALAWSVTGAFRRLGPNAFLLTDDIEGIGTRQERVARWRTEVGQKQDERVNQAQTRLDKRNPLARLTFSPTDPLRLTLEQEQRLRTWPKRTPEMELKAEELPAPLRDWALQNADSVEKNDANLRLDRHAVKISLSAVFAVYAPDGKRIHDVNNEFGSVSTTLDQLMSRSASTSAPPESAPTTPEPPPLILSPKVKRRILIARITDEKDAAPLVTEAKKRSFTDLWIAESRAKTGDADLAPLRAAVAEGKKAKLPVGALVLLWRVTGKDAGDIPGGEPDFDILGGADDETTPGTQWTAPTETAAAEIARRAARLAAVPGLRGLAIQYAFARGYSTERLNVGYINPVLEYQRGYISSFRLSFVRAQQIDPVDMPPNPSGKGPLPFFPEDTLNDTLKFVGGRPVRDDSQPGAAWSWRRFREKKSLAALAAVFAAVRKVAPKLPLYQSERLTDIGEKAPGFFAEWNAPDKIIRRPRFGGLPDDLSAVREVSPLALIYLSPYSYNLPDKFGGKREEKIGFIEFASTLFGVEAQTDGAVLDLSALPPADGLKCLRDCFAAP